MNKKLILIALSVVMFSTVSFAQKVIKNGSAVIIDCSNMDPKFYSSKKIEPRTTTATNSSGPTNGAADISSLENNAKVYKKFEVHGTDNEIISDWKSAVTLCANLNSKGTGWRLPTQRELMLMWILKEKLYANGLSPFNVKKVYWSVTGYIDAARCMKLINGSVGGNAKSFLYNSVRCVRDLD